MAAISRTFRIRATSTPWPWSNHAQDNTKYNNLVGSFNTHVQLPVGFAYDLNLSYQNNTSLHGESYDSYYTQYNSANFYNNPDPPLVHSLLNFGINGSALRNTYQTTRKVLETFFTWDKSFGDHSLNAVLGYSWQGNVSGDGFQTSSTNFPGRQHRLQQLLRSAILTPYRRTGSISGRMVSIRKPGSSPILPG